MFVKLLKPSNWKLEWSPIELTDLENPDIILMLSCPIQEKKCLCIWKDLPLYPSNRVLKFFP